MSKKITLTIDTVHFNIDVEEHFANYLTTQMEKDFNIDGNNELKDLLQAYVRKNHALYLADKEHINMNEKLEIVLSSSSNNT